MTATIINQEIEIDLDDMIEPVSENYTPEGVFDDSELVDWAEDHGFIHEEKFTLDTMADAMGGWSHLIAAIPTEALREYLEEACET